jgi:hypothetical protein
VHDKTEKIEGQLAKLKERNDENEISIFMHQIYNEVKSLSKFEDCGAWKLILPSHRSSP